MQAPQKYRLLVVTLAMIFVLILLPAIGLSTYVPPLPKDVYVGQQNVRTGQGATYWLATNGSVVPGSLGNHNVRYDPASSTLYLKNAVITENYETAGHDFAGIFTYQKLIIDLEGTNIIQGQDAAGNTAASYAIFCDALTITGSGTLEAIGGGAQTSFGIYAPHGLDIHASTISATGGTAAIRSCGLLTDTLTVRNAALTAKGGDIKGNIQQIHSEGIFSNTVIMYSGSIDAQGGKAESSQQLTDSIGLGTNNLEMRGGTITARGGQSIADNSDAYSTGLLASADITIYNGTLRGQGGEAASKGDNHGESKGIDCNNMRVISGTLQAIGGPVTAASASSTGLSVMREATSRLTIQGGTLTAVGGEATPSSGTPVAGTRSHGISICNMEVTGGHVQCVGGKAYRLSDGIDALGGVTVSGGKVVATGGISTAGNSNGINTTSTSSAAPGIAKFITVLENGILESMGGGGIVSLGVFGQAPITLNGGTTTLQGNTRALHAGSAVLPTLKIGMAAYEYKIAETPSDPSGGFINSGIKPYAWDMGQKYITIRAASSSGIGGASGGGSTGNASFPILEGANSGWQPGNGNLVFRSAGEYNRLQSVYVDGEQRQQEVDYLATPGSTIITLKQTFLATLAPGVHTLRVEFTDGYSQSNFTIGDLMAPPKTGGSTGMGGLACALGLGVALLCLRRKRI